MARGASEHIFNFLKTRKGAATPREDIIAYVQKKDPEAKRKAITHRLLILGKTDKLDVDQREDDVYYTIASDEPSAAEVSEAAASAAPSQAPAQAAAEPAKKRGPGRPRKKPAPEPVSGSKVLQQVYKQLPEVIEALRQVRDSVHELDAHNEVADYIGDEGVDTLCANAVQAEMLVEEIMNAVRRGLVQPAA